MSMTIDDIVREMRKDMPRVIDPKVILCNYADRIEAAHKREREATCKESLQVGNAAKMREALENIKECYENDYLSLDRDPGDVLGNAALLAENALAEPPRNCDLFGGDPKKLHELWWEWSGDLKNCNADGTVKFTFGEWLLKLANAKGGAQ